MGIDLRYGSDSTHIYVSGTWYPRGYRWLAYPLHSFPSGGIFNKRPDYYQDYQDNLRKAKEASRKAQEKQEKDRWRDFSRKFSQGFFGWKDGDEEAMPSQDKNYPYSVFGLTRSASDEDMKKAYRKSVLKAHPDKGGTTDLFRKVREAWEYFKKRI